MTGRAEYLGVELKLDPCVIERPLCPAGGPQQGRQVDRHRLQREAAVPGLTLDRHQFDLQP
jgi:hypothetical protein